MLEPAVQEVLRLHTLMMTRRTLLGALKCAFRDLRRELASCAWTLAIVAVVSTVGVGEEVRSSSSGSKLMFEWCQWVRLGAGLGFADPITSVDRNAGITRRAARTSPAPRRLHLHAALRIPAGCMHLSRPFFNRFGCAVASRIRTVQRLHAPAAQNSQISGL
jgi:hypothetical protein